MKYLHIRQHSLLITKIEISKEDSILCVNMLNIKF